MLSGSKSDRDIAEKTIEIFERFGIEYTIVVAAHTTRPVIRVTVKAALDGMDALLSISYICQETIN